MLFLSTLHPIAQCGHEPLYQFWVWCLGVIGHVGHQLAKKLSPLWDAHLFSELGQAQSQRAAGMKGRVWEDPDEKTRVGGTASGHSLSAALLQSTLILTQHPWLPCLHTTQRSETDRCTRASRLGCLTHTCIHAFMQALSVFPLCLSVKLFG